MLFFLSLYYCTITDFLKNEIIEDIIALSHKYDVADYFTKNEITKEIESHQEFIQYCLWRTRANYCRSNSREISGNIFLIDETVQAFDSLVDHIIFVLNERFSSTDQISHGDFLKKLKENFQKIQADEELIEIKKYFLSLLNNNGKEKFKEIFKSKLGSRMKN